VVSLGLQVPKFYGSFSCWRCRVLDFLGRLEPISLCMHPLILAITGASGAIYAVRLLEVLLASGREVHLLISPSGKAVLKQELGFEVDLERFDPSPLFEAMKHPLLQSEKPPIGRLVNGKLIYHRHDDFMTPPASGSF